MAFLLPAPPPKQGGKFSQFIQGVGEGVGDDLPQLLNNFFEQKNLSSLHRDLEDVDTTLDKMRFINNSNLSPEKKKSLIEQAQFEAFQKTAQDVQDNKDVTDVQLLEQQGNPQAFSALTYIQKQQREGRKTEAQFTKDKTSYLQHLPADIKEVIGKETWDLMSAEQRNSILNFGASAYDSTLDPLKARELVIKKVLEGDALEGLGGVEGRKAQQEKSFFERGSEASIAGRAAALARGQPLSEYEKQTALPKNANLLERTLYGLGKFAADSPFYFAGGTAGGLAGGALGAGISAPTVVGVPFAAAAGVIAGSGFGAFAVPAMVEKGLTLFQDYLEKGGEATFGDFIDSAAETLVAGVDAGVEGSMFGTLSKLRPLLSKSPVFKKLFNMKSLTGKAAQEATLATFQTGGILGSRVASGQKVTGDDAADLFAQVFGFNVMHRLSPKLKKTVAKKIEKSGIEPQDFTENVKERLKSQNQDPNNPAHLTKAINDVSKEYSKAKEVFKEAPKAEVGREQLEKSRAEKQKLAERITQEPVKEILQPKKPTKKVKAAMDEVSKTKRLLEQEKKNQKVLEKSVEKGSAQQKKTNQQALKLINNEVTRLENQVETQKNVVESLKPKRIPEPTPVEVSKLVEKHNKDLQEISTDPTSEKAKWWTNKFKEDQARYVDKFESQIRKGALPDPKFIDRYIRVLEPYLNAYKTLQKTVEKRVNELGSNKSPEANKLRKELTRLSDNIATNRKINESKQALHRNKSYVKEVARGKGNAYLKNLLKSMGNSAKEFEKEFFKVKKVLDTPEAKVANVGQKGIIKLSQDLVKNPTMKEAQRFSEKTGLPAVEAKKAVDSANKISETIKQEVEKGTPWEKIKDRVESEWTHYMEKNIPQLKKALVGGIIIESIRTSIEAATGIKLPTTLLAFGIPGLRQIRFGAAMMGSIIKQVIQKWQNHKWKQKLENAHSIKEKADIVTELKRKGWSSASIKNMKKEQTAFDFL